MAGKVLVADDSLRIQKELTELLEGAGVEVATVSNGEHAVRQLATVNPDLVLADIFMPVRTGYEVCEYIKTSDEFSHIGVLLLASKMEPYDEKEAQRVAADGRIEKPFTDAAATLETIKSHLEGLLATRPAPPIDEFAAAVPEAEAELEPESEPEQEQFATQPPPVDLDEQAAPMGFTEFVEEEEAPPAAAIVEAEPETEAEESVDLSQATLLTTADELKQRMAEVAPPPGAPSAEEEEEELPPAAILEPEPEPAAVLPSEPSSSEEEAELPPTAVVEPEAEPAPAQAEEGVDLSEATLLTTASELQQRMAQPQGPPEEEGALPAAEVVPTGQQLSGEAETVVEKPQLADAWEMTGPEPGAPEIPTGGGWDSQWKDSGEEAATGEEAPAEEASKPATVAYPPAEFAAAFGGTAGEEVAAPEEAGPAEEPAEVGTEAYSEEVAEEDRAAAEETAQEIAHALEEPPLDPALVEEVVNRVLERLTPERIESIARKVVHPLAEAILREKLREP